MILCPTLCLSMSVFCKFITNYIYNQKKYAYICIYGFPAINELCQSLKKTNKHCFLSVCIRISWQILLATQSFIIYRGVGGW